MFHDVPEARTGDFNYVNHKYDRVDEDKLYADLAQAWPFGPEVVALVREFEARATPDEYCFITISRTPSPPMPSMPLGGI